MNSPTTETPAAPPPAAQPAGQEAKRRRALALALIALGVIILALNLGLLPDAVGRAAALIWPAGVIALGAAWLKLGDRIWQADSAPFQVARGEAQDAELVLDSGIADMALEASVDTVDLARGELPRSLRPWTAVRE